jgi:hypothetical protein
MMDQMYAFIALRYIADGTLDWSFGGTGYMTTHFGDDSFAHAVGIGSDGTVLLAGYSSNGGVPLFATLRLNGHHEVLFADGFETGTTCAWSSTVP